MALASLADEPLLQGKMSKTQWVFCNFAFWRHAACFEKAVAPKVSKIHGRGAENWGAGQTEAGREAANWPFSGAEKNTFLGASKTSRRCSLFSKGPASDSPAAELAKGVSLSL